MSTTKTLVYRVFEDVGGYYFCDDSLPHLDTRGRCYPTREEATAMAAEIGRQHEQFEDVEFVGVTGSGVCGETAAECGCPVVESEG